MANRMKKEQDDQEKVSRHKVFGAYLRKKRVEKKLTLQKLGEIANVSPQLISVVENAYAPKGRHPVMFGDRNMKEISQILDWPLLDMQQILGRIPETETTYHVPMPELIGRQLRELTLEQLEQLKQEFINEIGRRRQEVLMEELNMQPLEAVISQTFASGIDVENRSSNTTKENKQMLDNDLGTTNMIGFP